MNKKQRRNWLQNLNPYYWLAVHRYHSQRLILIQMLDAVDKQYLATPESSQPGFNEAATLRIMRRGINIRMLLNLSMDEYNQFTDEQITQLINGEINFKDAN
jgi:hypothetical protein